MSVAVRGAGDPLVMADVVRELQSIADAAGRRDADGIIEAGRRAQSLLDRLRAQFVFEVAGAGSPSPVVVGPAVPAAIGVADADAA